VQKPIKQSSYSIDKEFQVVIMDKRHIGIGRLLYDHS